MFKKLTKKIIDHHFDVQLQKKTVIIYTGVNFIIILRAHFFATIFLPKSLKAERFSFVVFGAKILVKNAGVTR